MDHSIQNYSRRIEELSKQIDELNEILIRKDQEMIEVTNEIHNLRMHKESLRKEVIFRKDRDEQIEQNMEKAEYDCERLLREEQHLN